MLEVKQKGKKAISVTLQPDNLQTLDDLAELYNTTRSAIFDAMLTQFGQNLVNQKRDSAEKSNA